ncbi:hypothetical protein ACVDG3_21420 [Meridianimarinicoccus sp. RP-17]|uniref:hypothetical protein n=1 Tax=Meridianimarinicoccus zhengii TaxID=2056810 RepID=UPI001F3FC420|nr:hypothetical protein [Phycocomes zhengii]
MPIKRRTSLAKHMDETLLREIAYGYLLPFFSGASIEETAEISTSADSTVAFVNPQTIGFKVNRTDTYRLKFRRDQPFAQKSDPARETKVIEAFVSGLARMSNELQGPLRDDLLSTFQRRVVAEATAEPGKGTELLAVIDQLALLATRLYEGKPIASAIGIDPTIPGEKSLPLANIAKQDFFAVLSNGFDTMLTLSKHLNFSGHLVLEPTTSAEGYYPWRHSAVAAWTEEIKGRVAIVLNRIGEILVFRDGQLLFARRSGNWHFLTHEPIIRQMGVPKEEELRRAIYETALDASFARTGACIGVIASGSIRAAEEMIVDTDWLSKGLSDKAKAVARIVNGRKFNELDRSLRLELSAIDGTTVIDHQGNVIAVGAIPKIKGGSTSGGRTAAAKHLALLGLGVKISQDGAIFGYRRDSKNPKQEKEAFKVM